MSTKKGYTVSPKEWARGVDSAGFQTPARLFGSAFIKECGAGEFEPSRVEAMERGRTGT